MLVPELVRLVRGSAGRFLFRASKRIFAELEGFSDGEEGRCRFEEGVVSCPRRVDRTLTGVSCANTSESSWRSVSLGCDSTSEDGSLYDAIGFACRDAR
jgi:hypothetical protein